MKPQKLNQKCCSVHFASQNVRTSLSKVRTLTIMMAQLGESLYSEDQTKANINNPEMAKCLEWLADMYTTNAMIGITSPGDWGGDSFAVDKVGMLMLGHWFSASLKQYEGSKNRLDEDFILIQTPQWDPANPVSACLAGVGGSIYAESEHKEEAFQLLELYLGSEFAEARTALGWGNPSINEHMKFMPQETAFEKQAYESNSLALSTTKPLVTNPYITAAGVEAAFNKYFNEYIYGRMSI